MGGGWVQAKIQEWPIRENYNPRKFPAIWMLFIHPAVIRHLECTQPKEHDVLGAGLEGVDPLGSVDLKLALGEVLHIVREGGFGDVYHAGRGGGGGGGEGGREEREGGREGGGRGEGRGGKGEGGEGRGGGGERVREGREGGRGGREGGERGREGREGGGEGEGGEREGKDKAKRVHRFI